MCWKKPDPGPLAYNKNISIVHNNVCSILTKLDIIRNVRSGNDIIALSETHLDGSIDNSKLVLDGYQTYLQQVRIDKNIFDGGVALFFFSRLSFKVRYDFNCSDIEILWVEM